LQWWPDICSSVLIGLRRWVAERFGTLRCLKNLAVPRRPLKTYGACECEGWAPRVLKGVGHCIEQCEAFYARHSSKARKEYVNLVCSASVHVWNHGQELHLKGKHGAVYKEVWHCRLGEEGLRQQDTVAAIIDEAILGHLERGVLE
jgi:hypothetical protein